MIFTTKEYSFFTTERISTAFSLYFQSVNFMHDILVELQSPEVVVHELLIVYLDLLQNVSS